MQVEARNGSLILSLLEEWAQALRAEGMSARNCAAHRVGVDRLAEFMGERGVETATAADVKAFLAYLGQLGVSPQSQGVYGAVLGRWVEHVARASRAAAAAPEASPAAEDVLDIAIEPVEFEPVEAPFDADALSADQADATWPLTAFPPPAPPSMGVTSASFDFEARVAEVSPDVEMEPAPASVPPPSPPELVVPPPPTDDRDAIPALVPEPSTWSADDPFEANAGFTIEPAFDEPAPEAPVSITPDAPTPSTVGAPAPSTFDAPAPSTFDAPAPTAFGAPAPSTFGAAASSTFDAPAPSAFGAPAPSTFGAPAPSMFSSEAPGFSSGAPTFAPASEPAPASSFATGFAPLMPPEGTASPASALAPAPATPAASAPATTPRGGGPDESIQIANVQSIALGGAVAATAAASKAESAARAKAAATEAIAAKEARHAWRVRLPTGERGDLGLAQIRDMVATGVIASNTQVFRPGVGWLAAGEFAPLRQIFENAKSARGTTISAADEAQFREVHPLATTVLGLVAAVFGSAACWWVLSVLADQSWRPAALLCGAAAGASIACLSPAGRTGPWWSGVAAAGLGMVLGRAAVQATVTTGVVGGASTAGASGALAAVSQAAQLGSLAWSAGGMALAAAILLLVSAWRER